MKSFYFGIEGLQIEIELIEVVDCRWQSIIPISQESRANGKNGVNGPFAQLLVARGLKSGLELAVETLGLVWERAQRLKTARRKSVQVFPLDY